MASPEFTFSAPTVQEISEARKLAGHTQAQAARIVDLSAPARWAEYEGGVKTMPPVRWALYKHLVGIERIPFRALKS